MNRRCHFLAALMACCFWHSKVLAEPESLLQIYKEAIASSPAYLATQAATQAEKENEAIALGQLLPSLSISGNYGRNDTERKTGSRTAEEFSYTSENYNLSFRQPLFRKYNYALYLQGKAQGHAADAKLLQARSDLALKVASAYFEALLTSDQIKLLSAQKAAIENQLAQAEKSFNAGSGTRIDIDESMARRDFVLAQEVELENQLQHNLRQLASYVNRPITELLVLDIENFTPGMPTPSDINSWLTLAISNNAEFKSLSAQVVAAEQEVEKALAGHYPSIDIVASAGRSANDNLSNLSQQGDTRYQTQSLGLQLNIPLFAGGQVNAMVRQARAKLEQVRMQLEDLRRSINMQVYREHDNIIQGLTRIRALERAETSAQQTVRSNQKGIDAGVRTTQDVLLSEQQLYVTRRDLAQARYVFLLSDLKLRHLAGLLSEADIERLSNKFRQKSSP